MVYSLRFQFMKVKCIIYYILSLFTYILTTIKYVFIFIKVLTAI